MNKIKAEIDQMVKKIEKELCRASNIVVEKIYAEAVRMYDDFIDQYYAGYPEPISYIRHIERPNSDGYGLYSGQNITLFQGKKCLGIDISFSGKDMAHDYQHDSPDVVLANVMNGYRGVPGYWIREWHGEYNGEYFSYSGNMKQAFEIFESNIHYTFRDLLRKEINLRW